MPKTEKEKCPLKRLCEHCNKEFDVTEYSETYDTFVASIMNCPHCGKRNDIWVTFCKPIDTLTALEGQTALEERDDRIKELEGALEGILEYWNGCRNDAAMFDALNHIEDIATEALKGK